VSTDGLCPVRHIVLSSQLQRIDGIDMNAQKPGRTDYADGQQLFFGCVVDLEQDASKISFKLTLGLETSVLLHSKLAISSPSSVQNYQT
jgi:hypothetical protein